MELIERTDTLRLECPPSQVFPLLLEMKGYPKWWPKKVRFEVKGPTPAGVGTKVRISNGPLVKWTATVREVVMNKSIRFDDSQGAWEGTAGWLVEERPNGCEVSYKISIRPAQGWLKLLGKFVNLGELHSKEMGKILKNLRDVL